MLVQREDVAGHWEQVAGGLGELPLPHVLAVRRGPPGQHVGCQVVRRVWVVGL